MMDQILLFGDSITQQTFTTPAPDGFSFGAALSNAYIRRLDVVNRGFSGYNTRQARWVLPQIIGPAATKSTTETTSSITPSSHSSSPHSPTQRLVTVCLGANDARLPHTGAPEQHVPLSEYRDNISWLITYLRTTLPNAPLLLITPPPVHEGMTVESDAMFAAAPTKHDRRPVRLAATTRTYAQVVREVGQTLGVTVLDLWGLMETWVLRGNASAEFPLTPSADLNGLPDAQLPGADIEAPGSETLEQQHRVLRLLLRDGLHLSSVGYRLFYDSLMRVIQETWPELAPDNLDFVFPPWDRQDLWEEVQLD